MDKEEILVVKRTSSGDELIDIIESGQKYAKLKQGDFVVSKKQKEYFETSVEIKYNFFKGSDIFSEVAIKYPFFIKLVPLIGYMDNKLKYDNNKEVNRKTLHKYFKLSSSTVRGYLNELRKDDIIHFDGDAIYVNPWICYRGKRVYKYVYDDFNMSRWRREID